MFICGKCSHFTFCFFCEIQNSFGTIEYKDPPKKKKYPFSFDAFFGNRKHLVPGVKVHFTAVKESVSDLKCKALISFLFYFSFQTLSLYLQGKVCATDVKVAPGGTEDIEDKVYEGVVTAVLPEVNRKLNNKCENFKLSLYADIMVLSTLSVISFYCRMIVQYTI